MLKIPDSPKQLLWLDAAGALFTALFLLILAQFESVFGMPKAIVHALVIPAILLSIFSGSAAVFSTKHQNRFLRIVAVANSIYCGITLSLVVNFYSMLTVLGIGYFVSEMILIGFLVRLEWSVSN